MHGQRLLEVGAHGLRSIVGCGLVLLGAVACDDGAPGAPGSPGFRQPGRTILEPSEDLPGLVIEVLELRGGTGPGGNFRPGDTMTVTFSVKNKAGKDIPLEEVDFDGIMVSGPTSNYQRVLAVRRDLRAASTVVGTPTANEPLVYTYTFADPIPATYLPPINDTDSFGPLDGEMTGRPLVDGTYTLGIEAYKTYTVLGESFRDAANVVEHFLIGNASTIETREVVKRDNCNACHKDLRVHGTIRREVSLCVLCHTAGAEDPNESTVEGGTPGVTINFRIMVHRIHNGAHLPSVLGVASKDDGSRDYDATPKPYKILGFRNSVHDFSHVGFPVWPNLSNPLPRDSGYSKLSSTEQGLENSIRSGVAACAKCHGDPDGSGPLTAPKQGESVFHKPTMAVCGSCHDDIDWSKGYVSNLLRMPPQTDNSLCSTCHPASGSALSPKEAHLHPLLDPARNPGLTFEIQSLNEAGNHNGNGKLDPGETIRIGLTIRDRNGVDLAPSKLARMEFAISGPTYNRNILWEGLFPTAALKSSTVSTSLPQQVWLEFVGRSDNQVAGETFKTRGMHWNVSGATTTVWVRNLASPRAVNSLSAKANALQNYCDLDLVSGIQRGNYVVIDDGVAGKEEYLRVQWVDGKRLWFSSIHGKYDQPYLRFDHDVGALVQVVDLVRKEEGATKDYTLDPTTGTIKEVSNQFGTAAVIVSYTTDFVVPAVYPPAINDSPDLGTTVGEWAGQPLRPGTYTVGIWGEVAVPVDLAGESQTYAATSLASTKNFLVGTATEIEPREVISSAANCNRCHNDIYFHGSHRRGFDTCILCHGTAGAEDRPRYRAANAPDTTRVSIDYRQMLHRIHHGEELANASTYRVVGFGSGYPNNYTAHSYEHVAFPPTTGGTKQCDACHGIDNPSWFAPVSRDLSQAQPTRAWMMVCSSCHDSDSTQAHIDQQTTMKGIEACPVCHGEDREQAVDLMHKIR